MSEQQSYEEFMKDGFRIATAKALEITMDKYWEQVQTEASKSPYQKAVEKL